MKNLPVFATVSKTFGFVIERRFFALLRIIWLPVLLSVAAAMLVLVYQFSKLGGFPPDPEQAKTINDALQGDPLYWALESLNIVASLILGAMIAIAVHRMILREDTQPGVYFYWRLTWDEFRYILAWIGYFILVAIAAALPLAAHFGYIASYEGGAGLLASTVEQVNQATDAGRTTSGDKAVDLTLFKDPRLVIAGLMSLFFVLIALARFGLVFPIIVAEDRLSFWRSWVVTRGNVLRLIAFWIVTTVLAYVLILILMAVVAVAVAGMVAAVFAGGKEVGALGIIVFAVPAAVSLMTYLVVGITLFIAAMSFSYKALADEQGSAEAFA